MVNSSSAVSPDLAAYSREFQAKASGEMVALRPACARDVVLDQCSAIARMVIDYKELRDKIRALRSD